jgi:hypothetical protein
VQDHGLGQIVSDLKNPKSPDQLRASLSVVTAQVQTARAEGKQPNKLKIAPLNQAVAQVIRTNPRVPEAWQAAAALISYSALGVVPSNVSEPCGMGKSVTMISTPDSRGRINYGLHFLNCTVVLDDASDITDSGGFKHLQTLNTPHQGDFILKFENAHVVYRGGMILPVDKAIFVNCTFEFQMYALPPPRGRALTGLLLAAQDPTNITVDFTSVNPSIQPTGI